MKTYSLKLKDIKRSWHLIDIQGEVLGRTASKIAQLLQGKNKVYYTANLDCGDYVVVTNASKVKVTGKKFKDKIYYRHSGYPGGLKAVTFEQQMAKDARKVVEWAVKNMLPKNKLRQPRMRRLKVFVTGEHNYQDKFEKVKKDKESK
ncbi:50S ribosomal protein L13 [Patescibacteria group bacterium]